jgi:hypothetical protein
MEIGQSQLFKANVSEGTPPYAYQWFQNGVSVSGANDSIWNFTAISAGSFTVYVEVNDIVEMHVKSNTATVTVNIHDVAIRSVVPSKTVVGQGYDLSTTVMVADLGTFPETFNVTVYANTTSVGSESVTLSSGNSTDLTFTWHTNGVAYGDYNINAYVSADVGESNMANNNGTGGLVTVSIPGDVNGDFKVRLTDLVVQANAYSSAPQASLIWNPNADINANGVVDLADLVILAQHYGQHYP